MRPKLRAPVPLPEICLNCGETIATRFCGACGQENEPAAPTFAALIGDLWQEFLQLDGKVLKTLWLLLRKPGFLSAEYVSGRRIRYVSPFRLYFWATALFVLLFYKLNVVDQERLEKVFDKASKVQSSLFDSPPESKQTKVIVKTKKNNISINSPSDLTNDKMVPIYNVLMKEKSGTVMGVPINFSTLPKSVLAYEEAQNKLLPVKRDSYFTRVVTERAIKAKNSPYDLIRSIIGGALPNILIFCVPDLGRDAETIFSEATVYRACYLCTSHSYICYIFARGPAYLK